MAEKNIKKGNIIDAFVGGARNGMQIGLNSMVPNIIFGFAIISILNLTGLLDLIGIIFSPIMRIFGLPGVAATALMAIFVSMGSGSGVIASLYTAGQLTTDQVAILLPVVLLSGAQVQFMGRMLGTAELKTKYYPLMFAAATFNGVAAMLIMNYILI